MKIAIPFIGIFFVK